MVYDHVMLNIPDGMLKPAHLFYTTYCNEYLNYNMSGITSFAAAEIDTAGPGPRLEIGTAWAVDRVARE